MIARKLDDNTSSFARLVASYVPRPASPQTFQPSIRQPRLSQKRESHLRRNGETRRQMDRLCPS